MTRDLDPNDLQGEWSSVGPEHWTDYDRAMPYGDFDVTLDPNDAPVATEQMRHLEGFGLPAQQTVSTSATEYLHGDLIRSTMLTTGQGGTAVSAVSYTAFGEVIGSAPETRYQYGGGWGYESDLLVLEGAPGTAPIMLQHVGHRWYDPSIGRFIQRDPLGIFGGLNVYRYVGANPLATVDPTGLQGRIGRGFGGLSEQEAYKQGCLVSRWLHDTDVGPEVIVDPDDWYLEQLRIAQERAARRAARRAEARRQYWEARQRTDRAKRQVGRLLGPRGWVDWWSSVTY